MKTARRISLALVLLGLALSAGAQTLDVLYNFGSHSGDPLFPLYSGLVAQGPDGNLYSTTGIGGALNNGAIFRVTPAGQMTVLHSFDGGDGQVPFGGLTLGTDGNFYGTTFISIFKVTPAGQLNTLYFFDGEDDVNGWQPYAPPVEGIDGNFYGATSTGGPTGGGIYVITPTGTITHLHSFSVSDGYTPYDALIQASDGNFYGTTSLGGSGNVGTTFRITPTGTYAVLYNFDTAHGATPYASLLQAGDGNFYGTTEAGGTSGLGVIFRITPSGQFTVLHNFAGGASDGQNPTAGLIIGTDGNAYGTTDGGGTFNDGVIFKVSPQGAYSIVNNFDSTHGAAPTTTLFQNTNGKFYGDTYAGGTANQGTFFTLNTGLGPFVSLVPQSGKVGKVIGILGQGLTGTTSVSFNGVPAKFKVLSITCLTATVPQGATAGFVTVTTPARTLKSNHKFVVTH